MNSGDMKHSVTIRTYSRIVSCNLSPVSIQTQSLALHALRKQKPQETQPLAFLAVFVYATQAIAFEWKPSFRLHLNNIIVYLLPTYSV